MARASETPVILEAARMRPGSVVALLVMVGCATGPASDWSRLQGESDPGAPHAHLSLVASSRPVLSESEVGAHAKEVRDATFLGSPGTSSANPLAPCALLAAGIVAVRLNEHWYTITVDRKIPVPPPGTNLLGRFDEDIRGGRVPRDDPGKAAEITARLFVWYSWTIDSPTNTIIDGMTQRHCLELLLSNPDAVSARIRGLMPGDLVFSHSPAVAHYSAMVSREDLEQFFADVRREEFISLPAKATENPTAPCSLLGAFRLASRLNEFWTQVLTGTLRDTGGPLLERFSDDLRSGAVPREDEQKAAEIAAYLFASEILRADEVSDALISEATQRECLNEIFEPGLIRMRLLKEGRSPPLH